jgi:hypothetical protein
LLGIGSMDLESKVYKDTQNFPIEYKYLSEDHYDAYLELKKSDLEFTTIHAHQIIDEDNDGKFLITEEFYNPKMKQVAKAGQIAAFMLQ